MRQTAEHRYDVTFTASEAPDGRPVIALVLNQKGQAAAGEDHVFFLDPDQAIAREATPRIADFLTQYVKGFGVMIRTGEKPQASGETDQDAAGSILDPEVPVEETPQPHEPEPTPEEEAPERHESTPEEDQPTPPLQIGGEEEAEVTRRADNKADGG